MAVGSRRSKLRPVDPATSRIKATPRERDCFPLSLGLIGHSVAYFGNNMRCFCAIACPCDALSPTSLGSVSISEVT